MRIRILKELPPGFFFKKDEIVETDSWGVFMAETLWVSNETLKDEWAAGGWIEFIEEKEQKDAEGKDE